MTMMGRIVITDRQDTVKGYRSVPQTENASLPGKRRMSTGAALVFL